MPLTPELRDLLNHQVNNELAASYSYLAAAAWLETTPYAGFAGWMRAQSKEEHAHAMKFFEFLLDRDEKVELLAIPAPSGDFSSPLEVFRTSLRQEQEVTAQIHALYEAAEKARDHESRTLLQWFLDEQVEEEKAAKDMIDRLELAGDNPAALLQLDAEAGARATAPEGDAG